MSDLQNLIEQWQQVAGSSTIKDKSFLNLNNNKIMNTIIEYENQEKKEKEGTKLMLLIAVIAMSAGLGSQYYQGDIVLTSSNFIGFIIMLGALLKSIVSNRTDNFPDARILATKEYLIKMKEDIYSRRRRHVRNTILGLGLYIPAMFLAFYNIYPNVENASFFNTILMIILGIAGIIGIILAIRWFKKYDERTMPLKQELDELIAEIN